MKHKRHLACLLILPVIIAVASSQVCGHGSASGWSRMNGQVISSVVWSPDGRHIAFVVTPKDPPDNTDIFIIPKASIWIVTVGSRIGTPKLLHTAKLTGDKANGTPIGLFWISKRSLGWAVSGSCRFYKTDVLNGKTSALANIKILLGQSRSFQDAYGLDDVYYDHRSYQLIATGQLLSRWSQYSGAYIYNIRTGQSRTVSFPSIDVRLTMSGWTSSGGTTGSYNHDYYLAGELFDNGGMILWRTSDASHNRLERLAKGETRDGVQTIFFPRPSPDGRRLVYMESPVRAFDPRYNRWKLVSFDIRTKARRVIAHIPDARYWYDIIPGLGCPFSWSPSGKQIAYADASVIRILRVK
jgi:hypothetical protein